STPNADYAKRCKKKHLLVHKAVIELPDDSRRIDLEAKRSPQDEQLKKELRNLSPEKDKQESRRNRKAGKK
ncbi:MAG: hypothetical protein KGI40_04850, partial [Xanthomonadaceae bacterium]|nr:hypothetical protein [Xanthomonadaceae bacterium]